MHRRKNPLEQAIDYSMTYAAIGRALGLSKAGVRLIEARALRKLRKRIRFFAGLRP
jgi:DNA-directed RNA polymerase sigma subunit (sigma70/sigma32)